MNRVLYVSGIILEPNTAPTIHIDEVCANLSKLGMYVHLVTPSRISRPRLARRYKAVFIITPGFLRSIFYQIFLSIYLLALLATSRFDVMYMRRDQLLVIPACFAWLFRIPLVLEVNGKLTEEFEQTFPTGFNNFMLKIGIISFIEHLNMSIASKVICVSEGIKEDLLKRRVIASHKLSVITNGVNIQIFKPLNRQRVMRKLKLNDGMRYIVFVGALQKWQNLGTVLAAMKILKSTRLPYRLLIVGDGPEYLRLKNYIQQNELSEVATLVGSVAQNKVVEYINVADICLYYPATKRGYGASPFKVYEYLACAAPVLAADLPGIRQEFGNVIYYCPSDSAESLGKEIKKLLRRKLPGNDGRKFIIKDHSWEAIARSIRDILEEVVFTK